MIGAVALVAVLVVFVPMLLDSDPRPPRPELAIPPKASAPPLPAPPKAEKARPEAAKAETPKVEAPKVEAAKPEAPKSDASKAQAKPADAAPKAATAVPRLEGFAVQVGAFRDEAKLAQARQKLTAAGVVHYTERLDVKGGALTRLRAGPFPTREAAESALATLKRSAVDGKVVSLP